MSTANIHVSLITGAASGAKVFVGLSCACPDFLPAISGVGRALTEALVARGYVGRVHDVCCIKSLIATIEDVSLSLILTAKQAQSSPMN